MYLDPDCRDIEDDELHGPHFGDSDVEEVPFDEPDDLLYFDDSDE